MDDDFKVSGDLTDKRRCGRRSDTLPRFWRIGEPVGTCGSRMQECKFPNHTLFLRTNLVLVYQVSWLRAKAHFFQWSEELHLVGYKMQWTVNWFRWKEGEWKKDLDMSQMKTDHLDWIVIVRSRSHCGVHLQIK